MRPGRGAARRAGVAARSAGVAGATTSAAGPAVTFGDTHFQTSFVFHTRLCLSLPCERYLTVTLSRFFWCWATLPAGHRGALATAAIAPAAAGARFAPSSTNNEK